MTYRDALTAAMAEIAADPRAIFLGQSVVAGGTAMTATLAGVPRDQMIEFPVAEDLQLGVSTGLSLAGYLPISVFPRINFMMCCMSQLVLHLDAIPLFGEFRPKVIIRTAIPTPVPLDPGVQHLDPPEDILRIRQHREGIDGVQYLYPEGYVSALRSMLRTVEVVELTDAGMILPAYRAALARPTSTVLVEKAELYEMEE